MKIEARPYQARALDAIYSDLQIMPDVLLQGMMGCGKTFMSVRLIQRLHKENPGMQFLVLMHKQELCQQFYDSFQKFTDIHFRKIGICCAGLGQKIIDRDITIASIQTFVNIMDSFGGAGLIIVDEAHRIDINGDTQYKQAFEYLRLQRPNCRILGITATPARLGHGYIYGHMCKPGAVNLFPKISHAISYAELRDEGHLVPLKGVVAAHESIERDLSGVSVNGDYVLNQLGEIMSSERHLDTAVEAIDQYCSGYKRICVFCCTIDHAEQLRSLLGDRATTVHSQLNPIDRQANMMAWESGRRPIMTSVNILTEGFDMPQLDCLVFARPTLSSSLYLQAVGRVLRTSPGKDHGMLVDLTDNTARFGTDLDNVKITVPKVVEAAEKKEREMWKICPNCEAEVHRALRECSECGFEWPPNECVIAEALPQMKTVNFNPGDDVFTVADPEIYEVIDWEIEPHTSRNSGKELGKITYYYRESIYKRSQVFLWLCLPDNYSGFAVQKSQERWEQISNDPFPMSVDEFMEASFLEPTHISVDINGQYPQLVEVVCKEVEICLPCDDDIPF